MFSIQNIGLWAFPMLIGKVLDASNPGVATVKAGLAAFGNTGNAALPMIVEKMDTLATYDYTNPVLMLAGLGVVGLMFAFLLRHADKTSGFGLEQPNRTQSKKEEPQAAEA